jgi:hypothetical protein
MLTGLPDVKPDRMVIRFLAAALSVEERSVAPDRAVALVQAAAKHFGIDQRALDHEIWEYQSGKRSGHDKVSEKDQLAAVCNSVSSLVIAWPGSRCTSTTTSMSLAAGL